MKINYILILVVFFCSIFTCANGNEINNKIRTANNLFVEGKYIKGLYLLKGQLYNKKITLNQRIIIFNAIAKYYEKFVGNFDLALKYYKKIINFKKFSNKKLYKQAQNQVKKYNFYKKKYKKQNELLNRVKILINNLYNKKDLDTYIKELTAILNNEPNYYKKFEVYYYLGILYEKKNNNFYGYKYFKKILKLKPAIDQYLPVKNKKQIAYFKLKRQIKKTLIFGFSWIILIIAIIFFYLSKPWQWLKLKHLLVFIIINFLWIIVFSISVELYNKKFMETKLNKIEKKVDTNKTFFTSGFNSPGKEIIKSTFYYGGIGLFVLYVFAIGVGKTKKRWKAFLLNAVFSLSLISVLLSHFYMRNIEGNYLIEKSDSFICDINSYYYIKIYDPIPYILTDPKKFSSLEKYIVE